MRGLVDTYRDAFSGLSREVWLLSVVGLVNRVGTMVVPFLSLYLVSEHGFSAQSAGLIMSLYGVGALVGSWLGGKLTDGLGPMRAQRASLLGSSGLFVLLGHVETDVAIGAVTLVLATVNESFRPPNMAAMTLLSDVDTRTRTFGLNRLMLNLGMSIGPVIGGVVALYNYRWIFYIDGATTLTAGLVLWFLFPRELDRTEDQSARLGPEPRTRPSRDATFMATLLAIFGINLVFFQAFMILPIYIKTGLGLDERMVGVLFAINTISILLLEMVLLRATERFRRMTLVTWGSLMIALAYLVLGLWGGVLGLVLNTALWTAGEMLAFPALSAWVGNRSDEASVGAYMAWLTIPFAAAHAVAPLLGGVAYDRLPPDAFWLGCGGLGLVCTVPLWLLIRGEAIPASAAADHKKPGET